MKVLFRTLLIYLLLASQSLYAVEIERLYEVEVIANSESKQDKIAAIRQAMKIVLTRILAGKDILQDATVKSVLANATRYVSEFQYSLVSTDKKKNENARLMRVLFDEKLLVDLLRPGKLDFWNEIRSRTLVWLIVEESGKKRFFDATLMPEVDAAMEKASMRKGLPILYPIQDLKEKQSLSISDVLSAYSEHLLEVSERYDVVSTLAAKMVKNGSCWKAEWTFYFDSIIEQWRSQCSSVNNVALTGFQGVYNRLSKYYAVKSDKKVINSVVLKVFDIKGMQELGRVSNYLESLPMVKTVTWFSVASGYNSFRIFYQGGRQSLNNTLAKDRILIAEDYSRQNADGVKYRLLPE